MDIFQALNGPRLIGIGEAVVLEVRKEPNQTAHQVKISHPDIGTTSFIPFIASAGMYRVPRVGDICYVFCNEGFHQYPVAWGHRISPQLASQLLGSRADNTTIIYSSGANNNKITHKIELDDGTEKGIRLSTESGHKVNLKDDGDITVTHKDGSSLLMAGDTITISAGGSTLVVGSNGISITAATGSTLDVGATIKGTAADKRSTFDETGVATHNHTGNLGVPTTPPIKGT
jgi:hypothetical protein